MDKNAIACPYCNTTIGPLSGEDGTVITIVCSNCCSHSKPTQSLQEGISA